VQREPAWQKTMDEMDLWPGPPGRKGRPVFLLHDGPPYANGDFHMGHLINKVLRTSSSLQTMEGFDSLRAGWDCHRACRSSTSARRNGPGPGSKLQHAADRNGAGATQKNNMKVQSVHVSAGRLRNGQALLHMSRMRV